LVVDFLGDARGAAKVQAALDGSGPPVILTGQRLVLLDEAGTPAELASLPWPEPRKTLSGVACRITASLLRRRGL
jgi:hypothetical protein